MNVSGIFSPGKKFTLGCYQIVPPLISGQSLGVEFSEKFWGHVLSHYFLDFVTGRPNVLQKDGVAFGVLAKGLSLKVNVNGACECICYNKRRRSQIVSTGKRVNSAFEVSVTRKNCRCNEILSVDGVVNFIGKLSGVSNASHAAVAGRGKAKFIKVLIDA